MNSEFIRPSKEAVREMPLFDGISLEQIIVVRNETELLKARDVVNGKTAVGFDSESKPTFKKGQGSEGPHVIQIATSSHALLFTPHFMPGVELALKILQSDGVTKYGFGLSGDKSLFRKKFGVEITNAVDLAPVAKKAFGFKQNVGARSAVAILFKQRLSKTAQMSNWGRDPLEQHQIKYAANDAYAGLCVAKELEKLGLIDK